MSYLIFILFYIWQAFLIWQVALRMGERHAWLAWVPLASDYLVARLAGKHFGWWLLFYLPLINIYIAYRFWSEIIRRYGKPAWLGLLMLIPLVNWLMLILLAFVFQYPEPQIINATESAPQEKQEIVP